MQKKILIVFPSVDLMKDIANTFFLPESYERMHQCLAQDGIDSDFAFFDANSSTLTWILRNKKVISAVSKCSLSSLAADKKLTGSLRLFLKKPDKKIIQKLFRAFLSDPPQVSELSSLGQYDYIGFSLMTPRFFAEGWYQEALEKSLRVFKEKFPKTPFIAGGIGVWNHATEALFKFGFDLVGGGYAEKSLVHIIKKFQEPKTPLTEEDARAILQDAPGGIFLKFFDGVNFKLRISSGKFPKPFYHLNRSKRSILEIFTFFGCPAQCTFCYYGGLSAIVAVPVELVLQQIADASPSLLLISDVCFLNEYFPERIKSILQGICDLKANGSIPKHMYIWVMGRSPGLLDENLLKLAKNAGVSSVEVGFESGSDLFLKEVKKGATVEQNIRAMELCARIGLDLVGDFVLVSENTNVLDTMKTLKLIAYSYQLSPNNKVNINPFLFLGEKGKPKSSNDALANLAAYFLYEKEKTTQTITGISKKDFKEYLETIALVLTPDYLDSIRAIHEFDAGSTDPHVIRSISAAGGLTRNKQLTKTSRELLKETQSLYKHMQYDKNFQERVKKSRREVARARQILSCTDIQKCKRLFEDSS